MTRRDFFVIFSAVLAPIPFLNFKSQIINLKLNSSHVVNPNTQLTLPTNAKKGNFVHLVVPAESMYRPAEILFEGVSILEEKENLRLDSFGLFKLQFQGQRKGWSFSSEATV